MKSKGAVRRRSRHAPSRLPRVHDSPGAQKREGTTHHSRPPHSPKTPGPPIQATHHRKHPSRPRRACPGTDCSKQGCRKQSVCRRQSRAKTPPEAPGAAPNTPSDGRRRAHGGPEPAPEHDARASQIKGCGTADAVAPQVVRFPDHGRQFECGLRVQLTERRRPETGKRTQLPRPQPLSKLTSWLGWSRSTINDDESSQSSPKRSASPSFFKSFRRSQSPTNDDTSDKSSNTHGSQQDLELLAAQEAALEAAGGAAVEQGHKLQHYCRGRGPTLVEVTEASWTGTTSWPIPNYVPCTSTLLKVLMR